MSIEISNVELSGVVLSGTEDFTSVPGLTLYLDARFNKFLVEVSGEEFVSIWNTVSGLNIGFFGLPNRLPKNLENFIHAYNTVDPGITRVLRRNAMPDFTFFHSNNFGLFTICRYNYVSGANPSFFRNGDTSAANYGALMRPSGSNRLQYRMVDGSGVVAAQVTSAAVFPPNEIFHVGLVRRALSGSNNLVWYKNESQVSTNTISGGVANSPEGIMSPCEVDNNTIADTWTGLMLLYDWSGYSQEQIDVFTSRVNSIVAQIRPIFTL